MFRAYIAGFFCCCVYENKKTSAIASYDRLVPKSVSTNGIRDVPRQIHGINMEEHFTKRIQFALPTESPRIMKVNIMLENIEKTLFKPEFVCYNETG